jgi:hypothetical protein
MFKLNVSPFGNFVTLKRILLQAVSGRLRLILCQHNVQEILRRHHAASEAILREVHGRVDMLVREERHLVVAVLLLIYPDQLSQVSHHIVDTGVRRVSSVTESLQELLRQSRSGALEAMQSLEAGCTALFQVNFENIDSDCSL